MNKNIVIKLDPMTDGFTEDKVAENAIRADRHALIIATNGDLRLTDLREADRIIDSFERFRCGGSVILGESDFIVLFNDNKAFDLEEGRFFVGSMLVMKIAGNRLLPLSDEEIVHVQDLLDCRMATLVAGDQKYSALALA
jgi:hypothetical protein